MKYGKYSINITLDDDHVSVSCEGGTPHVNVLNNAWLWTLGAIVFPDENHIKITDDREHRQDHQKCMSFESGPEIENILGFENIIVIRDCLLDPAAGTKIVLYKDYNKLNGSDSFGILFEKPYDGKGNYTSVRYGAFGFSCFEEAVDEFSHRINHYLNHYFKHNIFDINEKEKNIEMLKTMISTNLHLACENQMFPDRRHIFEHAGRLRNSLSSIIPVTEEGWQRVIMDIEKYADYLIDTGKTNFPSKNPVSEKVSKMKSERGSSASGVTL